MGVALIVLIIVVAVFRVDQGKYLTRTARYDHLHEIIDATREALSSLKDVETPSAATSLAATPFICRGMTRA